MTMSQVLISLHKLLYDPCVKHSVPTTTKKENYTGLFEMTVGVLTTCHTQYTSDSSICIFLFNRTTLQVFVTYMHRLCFHRHQHDNR